ncbi:hypothetical protein BKI52_17560 [marine bacterium AO1-C]|nr:hypothetical protein BKI52_17560 [marine bacterium AO1-C]
MDQLLHSVILWIIYIVFQSITGYFLVKRNVQQWIVWGFPLLSVILAHILFIKAAPAIRMVGLIVPLLHAMKIVVANIHPQGRLPWHRWIGYYFFTVNMNPATFTSSTPKYLDFKIFIGAILHLSLGIGIIVYLRYFTTTIIVSTSLLSFWLYSIGALVSLSLVLHFGLLPLNTFLLKSQGIADYPVFKQPFKSKSIAEFWGKRWNLAFSEMTATAMFKPLIRKVGARGAAFLSFMVSGLLHEIAISLSVMKGFGLPLLYFAIHGFLMQVEKRLFKKRKPGTWWVVASLVFPLPILFHPHFVNEVVWWLIRWEG